MKIRTQTLGESLFDDLDLLEVAGWPMARIRSELTEEELEEMIDSYLSRSDDAVAGALSRMLDDPITD